MEPKELSFVPKYHHQLVVGVNAGKWMSGVSYEVIRLAVQEACRIVAEGHSVLVVDREGSNVVTDEEQRQRRMQSFAVRAEATREPEFEGEKMISVTYNGRDRKSVV